LIAIVTDSTAYMTRKEAEIYGVSVVPGYYKVNGRVYKERQYISSDNYSSETLQNSAIYGEDSVTSTRQPDVKAFYDTFKDLGVQGYDILCVTISSKLSSTYNSACIAASHLTGVDIVVVDSRVSIGGLFMLIKKARILAEAGTNLNDIANEITRLRDAVKIRYTINDTDTMRDSRRIGYIARSAASILNIRPIFTVRHGSVIMESTARSGYEAIRILTKDIPPSIDSVIIHYIKPAKLAEDLYKYVQSRFPNAVIQLRKTGPVIGVNTGPSLIAIVWMHEGGKL
jgi:DegV family protein with EDD domain